MENYLESPHKRPQKACNDSRERRNTPTGKEEVHEMFQAPRKWAHNEVLFAEGPQKSTGKKECPTV